jgi:hypothetical protein
MRHAAIVILLLAACSSNTSGGPANEQANPCATPGATYLMSFSEEAGGTCGPVSSQIININSDGTISTPSSVSCANVTQDGCTAKDTDCTETVNGGTATVTTDVTFSSDGSSASGLETLTVTSNGQSCTSTYQVSATRQ